MSASYNYWQKTLAGERIGMTENDPEPGFYRYRNGKDEPWLPLSIFYRGDELLVVSFGRRLEGDEATRAWVSAARHAIDEQRCRKWILTGKDPQEAATIGHNNSPQDANSFAKDIVAEAIALAALGIKTDAQGDDASRLKRTLDDTRKKVYADMRAAKKPHEEAAAQAAAPFNETLDAIDDAKEKIAAALTPYLKSKQEKLDKITTDAVAKAGKNVLVEGKKRATTLRKFKHFNVTDRKAALAYFAAFENPPIDFDEVIKTVSRRMDAAGIAVPGIQITEEERAV
jgi:transcription termination factor NusB